MLSSVSHSVPESQDPSSSRWCAQIAFYFSSLLLRVLPLTFVPFASHLFVSQVLYEFLYTGIGQFVAAYAPNATVSPFFSNLQARPSLTSSVSPLPVRCSGQPSSYWSPRILLRSSRSFPTDHCCESFNRRIRRNRPRAYPPSSPPTLSSGDTGCTTSIPSTI